MSNIWGFPMGKDNSPPQQAINIWEFASQKQQPVTQQQQRQQPKAADHWRQAFPMDYEPQQNAAINP